MSLWASVLVSGGHNEKDFYGLVTNTNSALYRSVLQILSWLLTSLGCSHVAIIKPTYSPEASWLSVRQSHYKIILLKLAR